MTPLFEHLIFDILLRLPTKQLIRFKSIRKSWNALISSPQFIACHNRYNETHYNGSRDYYFTHGILKNYTGEENEDEDKLNVVHMCVISSLHSEENINSDADSSSSSAFSSVDSHTLTYVKLQSILDDPKVDYIRISGPCHGLYCLQIRPWLTCGLMNPSLREFKLLPPYDPYLVGEREDIHPYYGFGFDAVANDYKVVVIQSKPEYGWQAVLYSLNSNSWKQVPMPSSTDHLHYKNQMGVFCFVNECYHWLFEEIHGDEETDGVVVLRFDMVGETFRTIRFPLHNRPGNVTMDSSVVPFELYNGRQTISLIMFFRDPVRNDNYFVTWVMKDYEDEESWTKIVFAISVVEELRHPVWWFYEEGELNAIASVYGKKYLLLYNSTTRRVKKLKFHGRWPTWLRQFAAYRESLVSLRRGNDIGQLTSLEII